MAKSANQSRKKDGKKGKKKNVKATEAVSEVPPVLQPNQTIEKVDKTISKANLSVELDCEYCNVRYKKETWFVQCDRCDGHVHFSCAGIAEIGEEDPWICRMCAAIENDTSRQSRSERSPRQQTGDVIVIADVHATGEVSNNLQAESKVIDLSKSQHQRSEIGDENSSTRVPSMKSVHSTTTLSSRRRTELELQRLEDELKIQSECDAQTLALKLEAVRLKASRQKEFLRDKHKALEELDGSVISKATKETKKSSFVSDWIQSQRKQNFPSRPKSLDDQHLRTVHRFDEKIDSLGLDVSIPIYGHEVNSIRRSRHATTVPIWKQPQYLVDQVSKFKLWKKNQVAEEARRKQLPPTIVQNPNFNSEAQEQQSQLRQDVLRAPGNNQHLSNEEAVQSLHQPEDQTSAPPRSRSTMFHIDTQKGEPSYTFSRMNQQFSSTVTNSVFTNQRYGPPSSMVQHNTANSVFNNQRYVPPSSMVQHNTANSVFNNQRYGPPSSMAQYNTTNSTQPIMSTTANVNYNSQNNWQNWSNGNPNKMGSSSDYERQFYDQGYSYQFPTSSTTNRNCFNDDHYNRSSRFVPPNISSGEAINGEVSQRMRGLLMPSHIASRQAIPKDLPIFTGSSKDWRRFIKRYDNSTDMCGYTNAENLERLDKCLKGKARDLIESLLLMPDSVPIIIETLREKYGRPEQVAKEVLKDLRDHQTIKADRLDLLSDFGYAVRNACNQLVDLRLHNYLVNPELLQEMVDKLPTQTKINWACYSQNLPAVTLGTFADWLYQLSRTINRILSTESSSSEPKTEQKNSNAAKNDKKADNQKNGYIYVHDSNKSINTSVESQPICPVCEKSSHSLDNCWNFKSMDVDQRWKILLKNKFCRKCLMLHKRNCHTSKACGVNGCEFKHHSLLHNDQRHSIESSQQAKREQSKTNKEKISAESSTSKPVKHDVSTKQGQVTTGSSNIHCEDSGEFFRIVPVNLYGNSQTISTYAYLDEGSSFTLMERHIANKLNLSGAPETICMLWTKKVHRQEESEVVSVKISGKLSEDSREPALRYQMKSVNVVDELNLPEQTLRIEELKNRYDHLRNVPIEGYEKIIPTMLIGIKHAKLAVPIETIEGDGDGPIATKSRLGWSLYGPAFDESIGYVNNHQVSKCTCHERDEEMHKLVKDHFTIENFGVVASGMSLDSKENIKALKMLETLTVRKGNRFETGLLWKNDQYQLPDSYGMAMKRLACLENKGSKVIEVINEVVEDYIRKGYVHKLSPSELAENHKRVWYLPLFTVINPKKPGKLRTVFDAAAKVKGMSLNSVLHTGPDLVPSIVEILRRFRENKIAIAGDIREMYHQVLVNNEDKHAQRFIWRNGEMNREPDIYVMDVLTFGSRSSPCSAQYVKNVNALEYEKDYPRAAIAITRNTYVDDLLDGGNTVNDAVQLIKDTKFVHLQGGFEIRNFKSNSEEVLEAVGETPDNERLMVDDGANVERVLGMFWDVKSDSFTFSLKYTKVTADVLAGKRMPTKRELLKLLMSVFDPLGLLQYYLVHLKILLQNVWKSGIKWDDKLPENLEKSWNRWLQLLPNVERLKIPRWHFSNMSEDQENVELHVFVDASDHAYASVAFFRFKTDYGFKCSLVGSKTRVAPLKYMSTTRKELMAALLGTRLSNSIRESQTKKIHRRVFWSDSSTVLIWLRSDHQKYSQFVGHRVGEILETTELSEWKWVSSKLNVADEATKWLKAPSFDDTDQWFTGPKFLLKEESEWPQQSGKYVPNGTTEEMKLSCAHSKLIMPNVIDPNNFSKWERAVRGVAFAIRWGKKLLAKVRKIPYRKQPLSQEEIAQAEKLLFRQAQWQGFTEKMVTLKRNLQRPEKSCQISKASAIHDCSPFLDESGIMRVEGRIDNANVLSLDAKHPIIMPRDHPITKLLMLSYHKKFLHKNHETAINELRQRFYIPRIRVAYRSARWSCKLCEIKRSRPHIPKMALLPAVRLEPGVRPFTYTGVDYFGPIDVMIGRRREKRWGVLLTCLTIRAIHIEIVSSLDTGACIKAIRNFINFRGTPAEFFSDNGTHFKGADNALKLELQKLDENELATAVTSCYTKWNFNPPASPHMGGCWERLIRTVKSCLKESMTTRTPQVDDLRSLLLEAMNIVNARPLTYIPVDSSEAEALTPNHFIFGSSNGIKPPGKFKNDGPYLKEIWKEIQRCADVFWDRFIKEYVPTLTRRTKWFDAVKPLEVGDIVLDINEKNPRNTYPKARVVEVVIGSKSQVRRARVQFADGTTLWRPAKRLAVLNVEKSEDTVAPTNEKSLVLSPTNETGGNYVGAQNSNANSTLAKLRRRRPQRLVQRR